MSPEATPKDGHVYLRTTASGDWSVERWISEYSDYNRYYAKTRESGEDLAKDVASTASVSAFLLHGGSVTLL